jgi:HAD superfamily hydrolase (TIGR01549 family)
VNAAEWTGSIDAVCFDFYNTLAGHRGGRGRGARLMEYLQGAGLESDPWEHAVLYDVFEPHAREYSPDLSHEAKLAYRRRLTERVFARLRVRPSEGTAVDHAERVWELLGPASLVPFADVEEVFRSLRHAGLKIAVVSNWPCGLAHFCVELGFGDLIDHVIASAEVGAAKPDPLMFREACRRLGTTPARTLHVGDTIVDDVEGARGAGLHAVLIQRDAEKAETVRPTIRSLTGVLALLGIEDGRATGFVRRTHDRAIGGTPE